MLEKVTVKVKSTGGASIETEMLTADDTSYLEFKNGENAAYGDGKVTLSYYRDGTQSELAYDGV